MEMGEGQSVDYGYEQYEENDQPGRDMKFKRKTDQLNL